MKTFRSIYIYVNCFNRLRFLAEVSTKLQKMHFFGQFKDHNSGRKHGNQTNDPIFSFTFFALLFQNESPIFCCPLFSENYLNRQARINKTVNIHTVNYHPSPSQLISRIHALIFLLKPKRSIPPESRAPKQNSTTGFYHYPPDRRELLIPPKQCFLKIFFPEKKGGRGLWS